MELILIGIVTLILFGILYVLQNWKYHQMSAKLPGPPTLPLIGNFIQLTTKKNGLLKLIQYHQEYGLRWRAWLVHHFVFFTINPSDLRIILNSQNALEKSKLFYGNMVPLIGQSILVSTVSKWKMNRKVLQPSLSRTCVESYFTDIETSSQKFVNELKNTFGTGTNDIFQYFYNYTMKLFCYNMMGHTLTEQESYREFPKNLTTFNKLCFERMQKPWYTLDSIYDLTKDGRSMRRSSTELQNFSANILHRIRSNSETDRGANTRSRTNSEILRALNANIEKGLLNVQDLKSEVITMMIAATETLSLTMSFACMVLGGHPAIQQRIYDELQECGKMALDLNDVNCNLKYLERFVLEIVRLFPGVPQISRTTTADIQLEDGLVVPKGTDVVINLIGLHRTAAFWPDPLKCDPDRFLPDMCKTRHPYSFVPFSKGPRDCIGLRYGMLVLKTTLANLLRHYQVKSTYRKIEDIKVMSHVFLYCEDGFRVELVPRNPNVVPA